MRLTTSQSASAADLAGSTRALDERVDWRPVVFSHRHGRGVGSRDSSSSPRPALVTGAVAAIADHGRRGHRRSIVVAGVGVGVDRGVDRRIGGIAMDAIVGPDLELTVVVTNLDAHRLAGGEADLRHCDRPTRSRRPQVRRLTSVIEPSSATV